MRIQFVDLEEGMLYLVMEVSLALRSLHKLLMAIVLWWRRPGRPHQECQETQARDT